MIEWLDDAFRFWFLTSTTYGTWLPGDERGFVSRVRDKPGPRQRHNLPGTPYDHNAPGLVRSAQGNLHQRPIYLSQHQAELILRQIHETCIHRNWRLLAAAVMSNHFHIVVRVPGDPDPEDLLRDFKSYASRKLNQDWTHDKRPTWWTRSGSKRRLKAGNDIVGAVRYVENQERPLALWIDAELKQAPVNDEGQPSGEP